MEEAAYQAHFTQGFTMTLNTKNTIMSSFRPGLGNKATRTGSLSVPAQSYGGATFQNRAFSTEIEIGRTNEIVEVQIQVPGIDSTWRLADGLMIYYRPNFNSASYSVIINMSYTGSKLKIEANISQINASTTPAFTINARIYLYTAPF